MGHWTIFHPGVFFLTFISYALYHMVRKTPSYVQSSLISEWTPAPEHHQLGKNTSCTSVRPSLFQNQQNAEEFMGLLNAIFLFVYAAGNFISGMLADRLDLRPFLTLGMTLSAVVMFIFGPVLEWTRSYSQPAYVVLEILSALLQSTGWPCLVPIMTNWFNKQSRGYLLGLWSSSPSVGSILAALMLSEVVVYGYEYAFVLTSSMLFAGGILVFFGLVTSPREVGLTMPVDYNDHNDDFETDSDDKNDDDTNILSNGERLPLLGKGKHFQKNCVPRTSEAFSECSDERSSAKFKTTGNNLKGGNSTPWCQDEKTQLLAKSKHTSCTLQIGAQTASANRLVKTSTDVQTADVRAENGLETNEKRFPVTKHQYDPDSASKSHHKNSKARHMFFHEDTDGISHINEQFQSGNSHDPGLDTSFQNTLTSKEEQGMPTEKGSKRIVNTNSKAIGFCEALLLPGVIPFSLCFAFLKLVLYVFFFWLPFYLASSYGWTESTADRLSLWYDVGGITGATVSAFLMSRFNKSALIMVPMMVMSIPLLYIYGVLRVGGDITINAIMLFCLGGLLAGVGNLLSAAVSEDLSQQEALQGGKAMSTVTGILEGSGTVGAALGQIVVPYLNSASGWDSMFYFLMVSTFLSAMSISPIFITELRDVRNRRKQLKSQLT